MTVRTVIIVTDSAIVRGGAEKIAIRTANLLKEAGIRVIVFAAGHGADETLDNSVEVYTTGGDRLREGKRSVAKAVSGVWSRETYEGLKQILNSLDPMSTIIHVHSWASGLSASVFTAARQYGFKIVITAHDYTLSCPNSSKYVFPRQEICTHHALSAACIFENCDKDSRATKAFRLIRYFEQTRALQSLNPTIAYVSGFQARRLDREVPFAHRGLVIQNPVPRVRDDPYVSITDGPLLFVGRLTEEKDPRIFCEACATLGESGIVVGDGPLRQSLESTYPMLDFRGWCSQDETFRLMRRARVLVFPSRWYEAAPLTPVEAQMVANLPCCVSDASAAVDDVADGETGLVFKSGDLESLLDCLRQLSDPTIQEAFRLNIWRGRDDLRRSRSEEVYLASLIAAYESALGEPEAEECCSRGAQHFQTQGD